jgi:hypothetical protein
LGADALIEWTPQGALIEVVLESDGERQTIGLRDPAIAELVRNWYASAGRCHTTST